MSTISVRNLALKPINSEEPLTSDLDSEVIDFKEMNHGSIQVVRSSGDNNDGTFELWVSLLCDPLTFAPFPSSDIAGCGDNNIIWILQNIPFRYAIVKYKAGTDTTGTFSIYARAKRT